jgi:multimeric flavodoxin WrbA
MKVLAINGSPRKNGNTQTMIDEAAKVLRKAGVEVESLSIRDLDVGPCTGCESCFDGSWHCPIKDDGLKLMKRIASVDGIILASPVYCGGVTAQLKAVMDRSVIAYQNKDLKDMVGGAICVGGGSHGGQELAVLQMVSTFAMQDMIVAGPDGGMPGAMGTANDKGDMRKDKEGLKSARELGKRMAELLKR